VRYSLLLTMVWHKYVCMCKARLVPFLPPCLPVPVVKVPPQPSVRARMRGLACLWVGGPRVCLGTRVWLKVRHTHTHTHTCIHTFATRQPLTHACHMLHTCLLCYDTTSQLRCVGTYAQQVVLGCRERRLDLPSR
jgi:hypothetical protein